MNSSRCKKLFLFDILVIFLLTSCQFSSKTVISDITKTVTPTLFFESAGGIKISQIQGRQHRSPLDGQTVHEVHGIATAIKGDGFYLQDPEPDDDLRTSEAVFVATGTYGSVKVGDEVLIRSGKVREYNPAGLGENSLTITQIRTSDYVVLSANNPLPEPVILGNKGRVVPNQIIENDVEGYAGKDGSFDPEEDGLDFYESLESMRVQVNDAIAISATSSYNEVAIVGDAGKDASIFSERGVLVIQEDDYNPERILLDDAFVNMPDILVGAQFTTPIIGIMDYNFGNFKLEPTQKLKFEQGNNPEDTVRYTLNSSDLSIATYNVENLDALDNPARLMILAEHLVQVLKSPDIIGLQEIQDNDGMLDSAVTSSDQTLAEIIQAIKTAGGPSYQALVIDPERNADGGAVGGNIRVALLYRTDRGLKIASSSVGDAKAAVEVSNKAGKPVLSLNPGRISPTNHFFSNSRKPLVAQFEFNGQSLFVIVNHMNSKGGDGPLYGDIQPAPLNSEAQRMGQAKLINEFVEEILKVDSQAYVVVMGDLNDFPWSAPVQKLCGNELVNLIQGLEPGEWYTYIYEGNGQVLDQILVSQALSEKLSYFDIVHVNAEQLSEDRLSDHDPILAVFSLE